MARSRCIPASHRPTHIMTNYHKLFLDSSYRAPPFQPAKPFFTLFNASNYWLQAALVIAVFIILNMMPFMRQAAHLAGGSHCPNLFTMIKDAFVSKEKVHDICNQTPEGYNEPPDDGDNSGNNNSEDGVQRRYKRVREARKPGCPDEAKPTGKSRECMGECSESDRNPSTLPPMQYRCGTRQSRRKSARGARCSSSRSKY